MSGINGDKARFNRRRKMKIHRRAQQRILLGPLFRLADPGMSQAKTKEKMA